MSRAARPAAPALADPRATWRVETVIPPEGVPLPFRIAELGTRLFAQVTDLVLTLLFLGLLVLTMGLTLGSGEYLAVIATLGFFFLRLPYYILSEIYWNGATLGKRLAGIKVINAQGGSLDIHAIVLRNLLKEAEVFLPLGLALGMGDFDGFGRLSALAWCILVALIPLRSRRNQRLGDILAGTMVVHRPDAVLLPDAATASTGASPQAGGAFSFGAGQLDHYGAFELQTLEDLLRSLEAKARAHRLGPGDYRQMAEVTQAICGRIGYPAVAPRDQLGFLRDFYRAQRRFLEERQLFGERRADKHHRRRPPADPR
jgi:uncharacterized RDD family membrane protein YckC